MYKKNVQIQLMSFSCINIETIEKKTFFFSNLKKVTQVQLISFYCINVETKRKSKNVIFFKDLIKFRSPANEFLLHKRRSNRKILK